MSKSEGPGVQINVLGLWKRKETTVESVITWGGGGSGERWDWGSEPVGIKKRSLDSVLVTMGSHQKVTDTREKNTLVIISEQSPWLLYCRQTLGSKAGDGTMGRWGREAAEAVQVGDGWFAWVVAMEKLRILYKLHLKFKKAILTSLNLK